MTKGKQDTFMPPFPGEGEKMTDELKYYKLECRLDHVSGATKCRYYSLYNGARGIWGCKEHAIAEGEAHKALIIALHKPVPLGPRRGSLLCTYLSECLYQKQEGIIAED